MKLKSLFRYALTLLMAILFNGCAKEMADAKQDALEDMMASKTWYVSQYMEGTTAITSSFSGFDFSFRKDHTVVARKGTVSIIGDWGADVTTKVFSANFNSGNPLALLNGNWTIYYQDAQGPRMGQVINSKESKISLRFR